MSIERAAKALYDADPAAKAVTYLGFGVAGYENLPEDAKEIYRQMAQSVLDTTASEPLLDPREVVTQPGHPNFDGAEAYLLHQQQQEESHRQYVSDLENRLGDCIVWMDTREKMVPGMLRLCDYAKQVLNQKI